jgi:hypothetical protein
MGIKKKYIHNRDGGRKGEERERERIKEPKETQS